MADPKDPGNKGPCPNCGRPIGFGYVSVEEGRCQLWRVIESCNNISQRTIADCFSHTAKRVRGNLAAIGDLTAKVKAAQRVISRHHAAQLLLVELDRSAVAPVSEPEAMFRDGARIESA